MATNSDSDGETVWDSDSDSSCDTNVDPDFEPDHCAVEVVPGEIIDASRCYGARITWMSGKTHITLQTGSVILSIEPTNAPPVQFTADELSDPDDRDNYLHIFLTRPGDLTIDEPQSNTTMKYTIHNKTLYVKTDHDITKIFQHFKFTCEVWDNLSILISRWQISNMDTKDCRAKRIDLSLDQKKKFLARCGVASSEMTFGNYLNFNLWVDSNPFKLHGDQFKLWKRWFEICSGKRPQLPAQIRIGIHELSMNEAIHDIRLFMANLDPPMKELTDTIDRQFWMANHINFDQYAAEFEALPPEIQRITMIILQFFAGADIAVNDNIMEKLLRGIDTLEAKCLYASQMKIETIHAEVYGKLITELPERFRLDASNLFSTFSGIENMIAYMDEFADEKMPTVVSLLAFIFIEGLFFNAFFTIICYVFRNTDKVRLSALSESNSLIMRDESTHVDIGIKLLSHFRIQPPSWFVFAMSEYALQVALEIVRPMFNRGYLMEISYVQMTCVLREFTNRLLARLGIQGVKMPISAEAAELIRLVDATNNSREKSNFLETISSDYQFSGTISGGCDVCSL